MSIDRAAVFAAGIRRIEEIAADKSYTGEEKFRLIKEAMDAVNRILKMGESENVG